MNVAKSSRIINQSLTNNHFLQREAIISPPPKVQAIWDTLLSTIVPHNEVTGNRNIVFIPQALEKILGEFSYRSLITSNGGLSFNREKKLLVEKVKNQLLPHIRREFDWDVQLVSSNQMNAFALPGGKIIICEGLIDHMIDYLRMNIDEIQAGLSHRSKAEQAEVLGRELESMLAAVMGHEIAHADIGHSRAAIQRVVLLYVILFIAFVLTYFFSQKAEREDEKNRNRPLINLMHGIHDQLLQIGFQLYSLAQSRSDEYEADAMGMQVYMHEAGYDLNGAVRLMDMFVKKDHCYHMGFFDKVAEFFSTHPLSEKRKMQAIEIRDRVNKV